MVTKKKEKSKAVLLAGKAKKLKNLLKSLKESCKGNDKLDNNVKPTIMKDTGEGISEGNQIDDEAPKSRDVKVDEEYFHEDSISSDCGSEISDGDEGSKPEDKRDYNSEEKKYNNLQNPHNRMNKKQYRRVSGRILELAEPKPLPEEVLKDMFFQPFTIPRAALRYEATRRIRQLAKPIIRKALTSEREDAFQVKKTALKAKCSRRIKELAKTGNMSPLYYSEPSEIELYSQNNKKVLRKFKCSRRIKNLAKPKKIFEY